MAREVLLQLARLTIPGVLLGLVGAWMAAALLRTFVFGVDPRSIPVLASVSGAVLFMAVISSMPSVMRAMRLNPKNMTVN
jgi:hypothetical protein